MQDKQVGEQAKYTWEYKIKQYWRFFEFADLSTLIDPYRIKWGIVCWISIYSTHQIPSMPEKDNPTVWSSEHGDMRKKNSKLAFVAPLPPQQQTAYLHRDSKGRGGKTVTLVKNLVLPEEELKALAKQLKQASSSGGTVKDGIIEIQGDHREKIAGVLRKLGYKVKLAGG